MQTGQIINSLVGALNNSQQQEKKANEVPVVQQNRGQKSAPAPATPPADVKVTLSAEAVKALVAAKAPAVAENTQAVQQVRANQNAERPQATQNSTQQIQKTISRLGGTA